DNSDTLGVFRDITAQAPGAPAVGAKFDDVTKTDLYSGKLTIRSTEGLSIVGSIFGDPGTENGPIPAIDGPSTTFIGSVDRGGLDAAGRQSWVLGPNWLIAGLVSYHRDKNLESPGPGGDIVQIRDRTTPTLSFAGGLGYFERFSNRRYDYRLDG